MRTLFITLILILAGGLSTASAKTVRIGSVIDGPWRDNASVIEIFEKEILALTEGELEVTFPKDKRRIGAWTRESVGAALDTLLNDPEVDLVLAFGLVAANEAGQRDQLPKPVIAPYVVDAVIQGIPFDPKTGTSGKSRFTYVTNPKVMETDLIAFKDLTQAKKMAFMVTAGLSEGLPGLKKRAKNIAANLGIELQVIDVANSAEAALKAIEPDVEAVYVGVLLRLDAEQEIALVKGLADRKLPSFSQLGRDTVELGFLAGVESGLDSERRARRVALDVQRILLRENAANMKVVLTRRNRLIINMGTARKIGFWPSWATLTEAELIEAERTDTGLALTIKKATDRALTENLDLRANKEELAAFAQDIDRARAGTLPSLSLSAQGAFIDRDRTNEIQNQARFQVNGALAITQLLYSEPVYANLRVQKHLQTSREYQRSALELDILFDTFETYLNVLRAQTNEQIQRDNLAVTRDNLELAQTRRSIGVAGPSEVLRWESQLANDRAQVISANAQRNAAEIALNRVLNRDLEAKFTLAEATAEDPIDALAGRDVLKSMDNPWAFKIFRRFMVEEALKAAPELASFDELLSAQDRNIVLAQRQFWLPTFALQGQVNQVLAQAGSGSDEPDPIPGFPIIPLDDTSWSLGLSAQLDFDLTRIANLEQAERSMAQLEQERLALAQRIEQRIRAALHLTGASYANIKLSKDAAAAARKNLEVIKDAYGRGSTGYLNLLDAQNAALVADLVAANAVYDFMLDFAGVQRAASTFDVRLDSEARAARRTRLEAFYKNEGYELRLGR